MEEEPKYCWQQCQDEELNREFSELHKKIVNEVIAFCKEHNLSYNMILQMLKGYKPTIKSNCYGWIVEELEK